MLCFVIGTWARNWGQNYWKGFLLSLLCSPVIGALAVLIEGKNMKAIESGSLASGESKKCPSCAELIKKEAKKCRFCGSEQA
jgi:hypothetical protein